MRITEKGHKFIGAQEEMRRLIRDSDLPPAAEKKVRSLLGIPEGSKSHNNWSKAMSILFDELVSGDDDDGAKEEYEEVEEILEESNSGE